MFVDRPRYISFIKKYWIKIKAIYKPFAFFVIVLIILNCYFDLPIKTLFIITLLNLILKENYPFSHYPMYSRFSRSTFYIFVTNEKDEPLPLRSFCGVSAAILRKMYESFLYQSTKKRSNKIEELTSEDLKPISKSILDYVKTSAEKKKSKIDFKSLRLYEATISIDNGSISRERKLLNEIVI